MSDSEDDKEGESSSDVPAKKKPKTGTTASSIKTKTTSKADSPFSLDEDESDDYSDGGIDWDEAVKSDIEEIKPKKKEVKTDAKGKGKAAPAKRPVIVGFMRRENISGC